MNKPNESQLRTFNMKEGISALDHHGCFLLIGQRHSGKNILLNELIFELDSKFKYENIFLFSATGKMNYKETWSFMREDCIFDTLDNLKPIIKERKESGSKKPVLLLFDDIAGMTCVGTNGKRKSVKYSEELDFLSCTGRHFNFTIIISIQNRVLCSRTLRTNCSLSFLFPAKSHDDTATIKNEYLGLCRTRKESEAIYDSVFSKPYNTLCVEGYKSGCIKIDDYVSQYLAPFPIRKFKSKSLKKNNNFNKMKEKLIKNEELKKNSNELNFRISIYKDERQSTNLTNHYEQNEKALIND